MTIARRVVIDARRKIGSRKETDLANNDVPAGQPDEDQSEKLAALRECLQSVEGDFVAVLRMRLQKHSDEAIAELLKIKVATVYSRASRGMELVRECVKKNRS